MYRRDWVYTIVKKVIESWYYRTGSKDSAMTEDLFSLI